MKDKLIAYFGALLPLSTTEKEAILEDMEVQTYKKGTVLLRDGQIPSLNYFVLEGCVRKYKLVDGEERTLDFYTEEHWILSAQSAPVQTASDHYLVCMEDCLLVIGDEERGNRLLQRFPKFQDISRMILEKQIMKQQQLAASFIADTPEQRYLKLQEWRPDLSARVPQYQLASYLGIKPESLSRIRKRIATNKS